VFVAARPLRDSLQAVPGGPLDERAKLVLAEAVVLLRKVAGAGMFDAIEQGWFADTPRSRDGGRGLATMAFGRRGPAHRAPPPSFSACSRVLVRARPAPRVRGQLRGPT